MPAPERRIHGLRPEKIVETIATLQGRTLVEYWLYRGVAGVGRVAFQHGRVTSIDTR